MQLECKIGHARLESWWNGGMGFNVTNVKWFAGSIVGVFPLYTEKYFKNRLKASIRVNFIVTISTPLVS